MIKPIRKILLLLLLIWQKDAVCQTYSYVFTTNWSTDSIQKYSISSFYFFIHNRGISKYEIGPFLNSKREGIWEIYACGKFVGYSTYQNDSLNGNFKFNTSDYRINGAFEKNKPIGEWLLHDIEGNLLYSANFGAIESFECYKTNLSPELKENMNFCIDYCKNYWNYRCRTDASKELREKKMKFDCH